MSIYIYDSNHVIVDKNTMRVGSNSYNSPCGRTAGIGLTTYYKGIIENITITNNIIIGTRIGVFYFPNCEKGGYDKIKILYNTLWNISHTPIFFENPDNIPDGCEMKNNFIYVKEAKQFGPKSSWDISHNYFYNTNDAPSTHSGPESKAAKNLDISTIFNKLHGCDNYFNDQEIKEKCFHPSKKPGVLQLFHSGITPFNKVNHDFSYCYRSATPSIGAFEFTEGCSGDIDPDESDSDVPDIEYDVKFKIHICTAPSYVVKMVGSNCNWNVGFCPSMIQEGNCDWSYTYKEGTVNSFNYKFSVAFKNSVLIWESDPNRKFNGPALASLVKKSPSGLYELCTYSTSGNIITLNCFWK